MKAKGGGEGGGWKGKQRCERRVGGCVCPFVPASCPGHHVEPHRARPRAELRVQDSQRASCRAPGRGVENGSCIFNPQRPKRGFFLS